MSQLQPKRIVLHRGLHKTGSTYIQRNLKRNQDLLLKQGVLYLGPNTFKKRCPKLWRRLQWGRLDRRTSSALQAETRTSLLDLAGDNPESIDTIFLSFEAIFGTLRSGLIIEGSNKVPNKEHKPSLYRCAKAHTKRLMTGLEDSLGQRSIAWTAWTVLFANRNPEAFIHSCHTQLIKEGHHKPETSHFDTSRQTADFSHSDPQQLEQSLSKLRSNLDLTVLTLNYDQASNQQEPSIFLWNLLKRALPKQADLLKQQREARTENDKLAKSPNPGLSERGLELAVQAHPLFCRSKWKLFRKFLEKNFCKSS